MIRAGATSQGCARGSARVLCISLSPSVSGEGPSRARETEIGEMATDRGGLCREFGRFLPRSSQMPRVPEGLLAFGSHLDSHYGSCWYLVESCAYLNILGGPVRPRLRSYRPVSRTVGMDLRMPKPPKVPGILRRHADSGSDYSRCRGLLSDCLHLIFA